MEGSGLKFPGLECHSACVLLRVGLHAALQKQSATNLAQVLLVAGDVHEGGHSAGNFPWSACYAWLTCAQEFLANAAPLHKPQDIF